MKDIKTLQQAIQYLADFDNCRQFMITVRWADGIVRCPYCGSEKLTYLAKARLYRCYGDHAKQKFSLKVGTVFEATSPISLDKWLLAVGMRSIAEMAFPLNEIHRAIGVTQKSAWFTLHIVAMKNLFVKIGGGMSEVEVDETFIGGKARNMHKDVKKRRITTRGHGNSANDKVLVMGMVERGGHVPT